MAQAHVGEAMNEEKHRPKRESARPHGHGQIMPRQRGPRRWCRLRRNGGTKGRPRRCQCADDAETRGAGIAGRPRQMSHAFTNLCHLGLTSQSCRSSVLG